MNKPPVKFYRRFIHYDLKAAYLLFIKKGNKLPLKRNLKKQSKDSQ